MIVETDEFPAPTLTSSNAQSDCRKLILIVDDSPDMLNILERGLRDGGYETICAASGEEALSRLELERPSIVIADYLMPGMDGLELCRRIRAIPTLSRIYFIMLTFHSETDRIIQGFAAGVNDFICKTHHPQELLGRLHSAWQIVQLEQTLRTQNLALGLANSKLLILNKRLEVQATTDELTGLLNRRAALLKFEECFESSDRYEQPLSCLAIDIDHFKRCNDTHGHDAGDAILQEVAQTFKLLTRASDAVCRMGGEEFLIICPFTDMQASVDLAERLRTQIAQLRIMHAGVELRTSVSVGVAVRDETLTSATGLMKNADNALYDAKHSGRNIVCLFDSKTADTAQPGDRLANSEFSRLPE